MSLINYDRARDLLSQDFSTAEALLLQCQVPAIGSDLRHHVDRVFSSRTQAYREVLLGCLVARILDRTVDVHLPYVSHGPEAFNGRDLDEQVVNPFLHSKRIPSTKGPYLSTFRRQARFDKATRHGVRDKTGYDSLLFIIDQVADITQDEDLRALLRYLLFKFVELREAAIVPLTRVQRFSLEQYGQLLPLLIGKPSGGLYPVLLVVCMFTTIKEFFDLDWRIDWQGINVADAPSGAGGDVTVYRGSDMLMSIEVTERRVDRARVISTFNSKIAPGGIDDYLFLVGSVEPSDQSRSQARRYFAQGHDVNFAHICDWIVMLLATLGKSGRDLFNRKLMELLDSPDVSQVLKVTWNESVGSLFDN